MGACMRPPVNATTKGINERLLRDKNEQKRVNKLLFLGPGSSGKSTIFKQLQWLHAGGFSKQDAIQLKQHIYSQITSQMQSLIQYYSLDLDEQNEKENEQNITLQKAISTVQNHKDLNTFNTDLAQAIQYIWNNEANVKNAFTDMKLNTFQTLVESTEYFWNELKRIQAFNYIPNEADIIRVRYKTTGVIQKRFKIQNVAFNIYDVGGQKSERRKWIHCFNAVNALVFVISMSCFNELMHEDRDKNAMVDSLELFEETINNEYFTETHIILFLNKRDLFIKKISKLPITTCPAFSDFEVYYDEMLSKYNISVNPNDYEQTAAYMKHKFESLNHSNARSQIFSHLTTAMNKKNIQNVFNDVMHIVIGKSMTRHGLL